MASYNFLKNREWLRATLKDAFGKSFFGFFDFCRCDWNALFFFLKALKFSSIPLLAMQNYSSRCSPACRLPFPSQRSYGLCYLAIAFLVLLVRNPV